MTFEEYKDKTGELQRQISELIEAYISEHAEYKVGEKVVLIEGDKRQNAVVYMRYIGYHNGEIEYHFRKLNKNGSVSSNRAYKWNETKIERL